MINNNNYNKLYLVYRLHNGNNIYWTETGNDTPYSISRRKGFELDYCGAEFTQIADFEFNTSYEAKSAQLAVNEVFKKWENTYDYKSSQINISIKPTEMIEIVTDIVRHIDDNNYTTDIMNKLIDRFDLSKWLKGLNSGYVYLMECANNKYKIGKTHCVNERFERLKKDDDYIAIKLVDYFHTTDSGRAEAMLHKLCSKYKESANTEITCPQDRGNSEMFKKCDEVMEIWNKYKESI